jgi:hypothetical protein
MKHLLGFLLIVIIGLTSCEGRRTSSQSLAKSIEEFKKTVNLEVDVFIPDSYVERHVDTLLNNGFKVSIKTFTDMENNVHFSKIKDTINYQTYYRNFKFEITIKKDHKLIYNESFNKQRVNKDFNTKNNLIFDDFDKLAVLKSIQINEDPLLVDKVNIDILYVIPETKKYATFTLAIDDKGRSNILQI